MAHSKYSDAKVKAEQQDENKVLDTPEHSIALFDARRCDGDGRSSSGEGPSLSNLIERSMGGDWSWKPQRYKADPGVTIQPGHSVDRTASLEEQMPTFKGVPKGAAELYRGQVFTRA